MRASPATAIACAAGVEVRFQRVATLDSVYRLTMKVAFVIAGVSVFLVGSALLFAGVRTAGRSSSSFSRRSGRPPFSAATEGAPSGLARVDGNRSRTPGSRGIATRGGAHLGKQSAAGADEKATGLLAQERRRRQDRVANAKRRYATFARVARLEPHQEVAFRQGVLDVIASYEAYQTSIRNEYGSPAEAFFGADAEALIEFQEEQLEPDLLREMGHRVVQALSPDQLREYVYYGPTMHELSDLYLCWSRPAESLGRYADVCSDSELELILR